MKRRLLLTSAGVVLTVHALTEQADAQAEIFGKVGWTGWIDNLKGVLTWITGWPGAGSANPPAICAISLDDLSLLSAYCTNVAGTLQSDDEGPSVVEDNHGLLPALRMYVKTPNRQTLERMRTAAVQFIASTHQLLELVVRNEAAMTLIGSTTKKDSITSFRYTIQGARSDLFVLQELLAKPPYDSGVERARSLIQEFEGVPKLAQQAIEQNRRNLDLREKTACG